MDYNHTKKEKIMRQQRRKNWYLKITMREDWKIKNRLVHRLIAITFIDNPKNKPCVNHKNWVKDDNRLNNLEWCTYSENWKHSCRVLWNKTPFQTNHPYKWKWYKLKWVLNPNSKSVNQLSREWKFIKKWESAADVNVELWINRGNISSVCRGKWRVKTAWLFKWEYA